ncbi:MAG: hypothetical protein J1F10_05170 [Muribaculaceae bacterium]|nr:hypothetical protein [Muribaculaceae bacterium]
MLHRIIQDLEATKQQTGKEYSAADIVKQFHAPKQHISVIGFMSEQIQLRFRLSVPAWATLRNVRREFI